MKDRRHATDHDTVRMVIIFLGSGGIIFSLCLGGSLILAVAYACRGNTQAATALQGLIPATSGMGASALAALGALLASTKRDPTAASVTPATVSLTTTGATVSTPASATATTGEAEPTEPTE